MWVTRPRAAAYRCLPLVYFQYSDTGKGGAHSGGASVGQCAKIETSRSPLLFSQVLLLFIQQDLLI